jgi:hypothetical protein
MDVPGAKCHTLSFFNLHASESLASSDMRLDADRKKVGVGGV